MAALITRRRRRFQPPHRSSFDWSHPASAGFEHSSAFYFHFETSLTASLTGRNHATKSGTINTVDTVDGIGAQFVGASSPTLDLGTPFGTAPTEGTFYWRQIPDIVYNSLDVSEMWGTFSIGAQHYSDNNLYVGWSSSGDQRVVVAAAPSFWAPGKATSFALTYVNGGSSILYADGLAIGSHTGTIVGNDATSFWIGDLHGSGVGYFNGTMTYMAFAAKAHDAATVKAVADNGLCMFRPLTRRLYFAPAAAAAFNAAWNQAANSTISTGARAA